MCKENQTHSGLRWRNHRDETSFKFHCRKNAFKYYGAECYYICLIYTLGQKKECLEAIRDFCIQQQPEVIVVSGDITQRAKYEQFLNVDSI